MRVRQSFPEGALRTGETEGSLRIESRPRSSVSSRSLSHLVSLLICRMRSCLICPSSVSSGSASKDFAALASLIKSFEGVYRVLPADFVLDGDLTRLLPNGDRLVVSLDRERVVCCNSCRLASSRARRSCRLSGCSLRWLASLH